MRNTLCVLLMGLFLSFHAAYAQNGNIKWGNSFEPTFDAAYRFLGSTDEGVYMIGTSSGKKFSAVYHLIKFDKNQNVVFQKKLIFELPHTSIPGTVLGTSFDNGQTTFFILATYAKKKSVIAYKYNSSGEQSGEPQEVAATEGDVKKSGYQFTASADQSKLLILGYQLGINYRIEQFNILVLDSKLKKVWEQEVELPKNYSYAFVSNGYSDVCCLNNGDMYLMLNILKGNEISSEILGFLHNEGTGGNATSKSYPLDFGGGKILTGVEFCEDAKGDIVYAATYALPTDAKTKGICYMAIDKHGDIAYTKTQELSQELIDRIPTKDVMTGKDIKTGVIFFADKIIPQSGGGFYFIAEHKTDYGTKAVLDHNLTYITPEHNSLIIFYINNKAEIQWSSFVPKSQELEYIAYQENDKLRILMNDEEKNLNTTNANDIQPLHKVDDKCIARLLLFEENGKYTNEVIIHYKKDSHILDTHISYIAQDGKLDVLSIKDKNGMSAGIFSKQ